MTIEEIKARAFENMQEDLDLENEAGEMGHSDIAKHASDRLFAKMALFEAMFQCELYVHNGKVCIDNGDEEDDEEEE